MANRFPAVLTTSSELSREWRSRSSDYGWAFPSDWHVPAVDAVCDAIVAEADVWAPAERLGRSRAGAGVSLAEALVDVDGLAAIAPPRYTDPLRRAVSLGWADRITAPPSTVADPLTGLATPEYLQVRLGEVYRAAEVDAEPISSQWALVVLRLDLTRCGGWLRTLPMILVADGLRRVFDGGESLALLGDSVAVVLCRRTDVLARRARLLCSMVSDQIDRDPQVCIPAPSVWIETLPLNYRSALDLIAELGR
ncbi:hypothetical protein ABIB25_001987 [Nakamurella sp. UYEF19]|uniref:GGDEF domain-containing protein n=1 Tax=Nakamurella sp. UYEF19 TaxID=1756392 RepID=UPI00339603AB